MNLIGQTNFLTKKAIEFDKIKDKCIKVVGVGGLGTHICNALVRMGFMHIVVIEADNVEDSNIPRQVLFDESDIGLKKGEVSLEKLYQINPDVTIEWHNEYLTEANANILLDGADIVLDGTDNLLVRYAINRYCYEHQIPWVYASAIGSTYSVAPFIPGKTPCFECVYGEMNESNDSVSCTISGIIITTLMVAVAKQVNIAVKILSGIEVAATIVTEDIWEDRHSELDFGFLYENSCKGCTLKNENKVQEFTILCGGGVKEVRTTKTSDYEELFGQYFNKTLDNDLVSVFEHETKQISLFKNRKILFYNFDNDEITEMLKKKTKEVIV